MLEHHVEDIVNQRQEIARKAFAEWLEKKRSVVVKVVANRCESIAVPETEVKSFVKDCPPHVAWLKKKNKMEKAKKRRESSHQKAEELDKTIQKQNSIEMYKKWLENSKRRSKPVPFGQGLLSTPCNFVNNRLELFINFEVFKYLSCCRFEELYCLRIHEYK